MINGRISVLNSTNGLICRIPILLDNANDLVINRGILLALGFDTLKVNSIIMDSQVLVSGVGYYFPLKCDGGFLSIMSDFFVVAPFKIIHDGTITIKNLANDNTNFRAYIYLCYEHFNALQLPVVS